MSYSTKARQTIAILVVLLATVACGAQSCATPARMESGRTPSAQKIGGTRTVVFIHGMYMTPACWNEWQAFFKQKGFKVHAPAWPLHDREAATMRAGHPDAALGKLTLEEVIAANRTFIQGLGEKPILIGHSMGALVSQILLAEGVAAAAIAIDSAPPKGIISLKWSFLKSNWGAISPFADEDEPIFLTQADFNYAFVNDWPEAKQQALYAAGVVPESRRVGKGPTTDAGAIDFDRARGPLLFVAGQNDQITPASLNRSNFAAYADSPSISDFREFPGRTHAIIQQDGWQEVAGFAAEWIEANR